jgi:two-component system, OmpR family, copper resistance phosphate regulon response regulator CusR
MKILIVEDEAKTAAYLRKGLTEHGYSVDSSRKGTEGLERTRQGKYDLLILDIMLPQRDGWSILSELRQSGDRTPVLVLTARDAVADRVKGLELGADDYLVKPFAFSELLARVRSVLRRTTGALSENLCVSDLEIDLVRHRAVRANRRLDLTPKELALLELFARHKGEVLTRSFLAEQVWDMQSPGESNVVDVHVRRLRAKVDDPFPARLIHTVRGVGYVLEERR